MPRHYAPLHDVKWLRKQYAAASTQQIADLVGCSKSAVIAALTRHGIPAKDRTAASRLLRDKAWLTTAYSQGLTTHHIAAQLGCAQASVYRAMCRFKIARRPSGTRPVELPRSGYRTSMARRERGSRLLHRQIMETHLGRALDPLEHVHHIDGDKLNNNIVNLVVLTKSEHHKLHGADGKRRMADVDYMRHAHTCITCGRSFKGGNRAKRCQACR